jgi:hypothetical protein
MHIIIVFNAFCVFDFLCCLNTKERHIFIIDLVARARVVCEEERHFAFA